MNQHSVFNKLRDVAARTQKVFRTPYYGFISAHTYLKVDDLRKVDRIVGTYDEQLVSEFERKFAQLVGPGEAVAYAAARMGFYDLLRILDIAVGDEVVLLGATCSVMVNAVLRSGASPIFSDIDPDTFGSSCASIERCITQRTRMIVAQHSFGIPCEIEPIVDLAKSNHIFLLEDCALTLGSRVNNKVVGNFGDAALFSTDHSKPLNTLTGGLIYTKNTDLAMRLRVSQSKLDDLPTSRQKALWARLLLEAKYCVPERYGQMGIINLFQSISRITTCTKGSLLDGDFGSNQTTTYPYPAKLPSFLAAIGLIEVKRWTKIVAERKSNLTCLLNAVTESKSRTFLPFAYQNKKLEIIPLRLAWSEPNGHRIRSKLSSLIDVSSTWFMHPIVSTKSPLESLGYLPGTCPISERVGPKMVNIPANLGKPLVADLIVSMQSYGL